MTFRGDDLTFTTDPVWAIFWISITLSGLAAAVGWSIPSLIAPCSGTATIGGITNLPDYAGFARLNFATPAAILREIVTRMGEAALTF
jgi:hypothetical protein